MVTEGVRVPTVEETVRTYVRLFVGAKQARKGWALGVVLIVAVVVALPPIERVEAPFVTVTLMMVLTALRAAFRESRLGGPGKLVVTAALTTALLGEVVVIGFVAAWAVLGGRLGIWRSIQGLPNELWITGLLILAALLVINYFHRKPERESAAAVEEAEVRAERLRRGARI